MPYFISVREIRTHTIIVQFAKKNAELSCKAVSLQRSPWYLQSYDGCQLRANKRQEAEVWRDYQGPFQNLSEETGKATDEEAQFETANVRREGTDAVGAATEHYQSRYM